MRYERARLYKSELGDGLFAYYVFRPIAAKLVPVLTRRGVSPNAISLLNLGVYVCAGVVCLVREPLVGTIPYAWAVFFSSLLVLSQILDCLDGMLARALGVAGPRGRLVDSAVDAFGLIAVYLGLRARLGVEPWLSLLFLAYLGYETVALSVMHEQARHCRSSGGEKRIVFGTLDYFVVTLVLLALLAGVGVDVRVPCVAATCFWVAWTLWYVVTMYFWIGSCDRSELSR